MDLVAPCLVDVPVQNVATCRVQNENVRQMELEAKLLLGSPDSALNGANQGPSAPVMGRELHSQSVPLFV